MGPRLLALACVPLLLLAGCIGGTAQPSATAAPPSSASAGADTGGIEGRVTTDELAPIVNAQIALAGTNMSTKTAEDGSFSFSKLEPGKFNIIAAAVGYYQGSKNGVEVAAGEVKQVNLILVKVPIGMPPFDDVHKYAGELTVSDGCEAGADAPADATKGVSWNLYQIPINDTKDGIDIASTHFVADLKSVDDPATVDVDMYLYDPSGKVVAQGTTAAPNENIDLPKYLPAGVYTLKVWLCAGAHTQYAVTVTITFEQGELAQYIKAHGKKPNE